MNNILQLEQNPCSLFHFDTSSKISNSDSIIGTYSHVDTLNTFSQKFYYYLMPLYWNEAGNENKIVKPTEPYCIDVENNESDLMHMNNSSIYNTTNSEKKRIFYLLGNSYEFSTEDEELNFLVQNQDVLSLLDEITKFIHDSLGTSIKQSLQLMKESIDWQTLFIVIKSELDWEKINVFTDIFYDFLYEFKSSAANKINISFIPNEF
jgi:hypothetical protein